MLMVVPARMRRQYWGFACALVIGGGWVWLGASGAALLLLWSLCHRPWVAAPFALPLDPTRLAPQRLEPWRLTFVDGSTRREVFRDELAAPDWTALRRLLEGRRRGS